MSEMGSSHVGGATFPRSREVPVHAPPATNRGVLSTSGWSYEFGVDWLQATFRNPTVTVEEVRESLDGLLGGAGFEPSERGVPGYAMVETGVSGAYFAWHPEREEMGKHWCLPAQALARVEGDDPLRAVRYAVVGGCRISRMDVRLDVPADVLTPALMDEWARAGLLVTRAQQARWVDGYDVRTGEARGGTWYLGSPKSERMLRVYDKQAESGEGPPRTRIEMQLRDHAANALALAMLEAEDPIEAFLDALVGYVDVRLLDNPQPERRTRHPEWDAVMQGARAAKVAKPPRRPSLERAREWLRRQLGPTLAVLVEADGGDLGAVLEAIVQGRERWRPSHRAMLLEAVAS